MSSSSANSLRPAWHRGNPSGGGKGFSPPPTVVTSERSRSHSIGSAGGSSSMGVGGGVIGVGEPRRDSNFNAFAALDDDDDVVAGTGLGGGGGSDTSGGGGGGSSALIDESKQQPRSSNSRSEALRAATRSSGINTIGGASSKASTGRSLADLAARTPDLRTSVSAGGRFSNLRSSDSFGEATSGGGGGTSALAKADGAKVNRYTRERLLSMRPSPQNSLPEALKELIGAVILSENGPQDPVCWDSFDAEEIWATVPRRVSMAKPGVPGAEAGAGGGIAGVGVDPRRASARTMGANSGGRWQRGVALPPPDQAKKGTGREKEADSPNELWDDPKSAGAASDFSAFGNMPPEDNGETFDFDKMAEASRKLEEDMHGSFRSRTSSDAESEELTPSGIIAPQIKVDPKRPLATIGTTIQSGSGDEVNVFEDFGDPGSEEDDALEKNNKDASAIRSGSEDPSASSRLMAMIGVNREETSNLSGVEEPTEPVTLPPAQAAVAPVVQEEEPPKLAVPSTSVSIGVAGVNISPWGDTAASHTAGIEGSAISMNPWGTPSLIPTPSVVMPTANNDITGLTIQAQLRGAAELEEQKRQADELRRRQEQEEAQRRLQQRKQEEEERARQQAALQQQQAAAAAAAAAAGVQSQVELVLLERISTILENSWGRSDLMSILATLHAEDSRVIPLLSTVDALRALIMRHPRRVALRHDPSVGAEMAILVMTNAQWQQHQQQEAQARAQMEELRLRDQQRRQMEEQQQRAAAAAAQAAQQQAAAAHVSQSQPVISTTAPWYYSDPQNNIQGPFRSNEMRQWLEAGYFKGDLPISQQPNGPFRPLSSIFPNLAVAFLLTANDGASAAAAAAAAREAAEEQERLEAERARAEAEALAKQQREAAEREQRAREEAARAERERLLAAEEAERVKREAAEKAKAAKSANGGNESSAQLKMMLGLSSQEAAATVDEPQAPVEKKQETASTAKSKSKASTKNAAVQQQRSSTVIQPVASEVAKPPALVSAVSASPASPWGGATQQAIQRKSMSEIQKEEARASAIAAMQREGPRSSTGGWANVAAARVSSTAWVGGSAKAVAPATVTTAATNPPVSAANPAVAPRPRQASVGGAPPKNRPISKEAAASAAEEFGAKMAPAMEKWCKDQMIKLNGSDDLTLVYFCMTLGDPVEIRQYLTAYLGSSPPVNNFANEFITKRGLGSAIKQEEWETTATAKKTRKSKKK